MTSQGESRFQWMAGAFYEDVYDWWDYGATVPDLASTAAWYYAEYLRRYTTGPTTVSRLPIPQISITGICSRGPFEQKAVFGELTYDLTDSWSVTGGARWFEFDRQEVETQRSSRGVAGFRLRPGRRLFPGVAARQRRQGRRRGDASSRRSTASTTPSMLYALYSEGFRARRPEQPRARRNRGVVPETYNPDKLENYELGFKCQWLDNRVLVNLSLFFMEWSDIQLRADASDGRSRGGCDGTFNGRQGRAEGC